MRPATSTSAAGVHLRINEIYRSLSGESTRAGRPCTLVRLTGCGLRCRYCDTAYAFHEGHDLTPIVAGKDPDVWREDMFFEHVVLRPTLSWEGVRNQRYKYARYFDQETDNEFLHDLQSDPDELVNLATNPEFAKKLSEMRRRTNELVDQYGAPILNSKYQRH